MFRTLIRGLSVCTLALPHCAVHACAKVEFETATSIYHDRLPELAWKPVAAARSYLVELTARVPEGPVVETRNLRTDAHRIDPPRLDASRPTKITIAVTPECASQQGARGEWSMLVLPSVRCGPVQDLRRDAASASRTIRWRRSVGEAYEVRAFDALSGALRSSVRADAESEDLPLGEAVVVAIRRVCPDAIGPSSYLFVD